MTTTQAVQGIAESLQC